MLHELTEKIKQCIEGDELYCDSIITDYLREKAEDINLPDPVIYEILGLTSEPKTMKKDYECTHLWNLGTCMTCGTFSKSEYDKSQKLDVRCQDCFKYGQSSVYCSLNHSKMKEYCTQCYHEHHPDNCPTTKPKETRVSGEWECPKCLNIRDSYFCKFDGTPRPSRPKQMGLRDILAEKFKAHGNCVQSRFIGETVDLYKELADIAIRTIKEEAANGD